MKEIAYGFARSPSKIDSTERRSDQNQNYSSNTMSLGTVALTFSGFAVPVCQEFLQLLEDVESDLGEAPIYATNGDMTEGFVFLSAEEHSRSEELGGVYNPEEETMSELTKYIHEVRVKDDIIHTKLCDLPKNLVAEALCQPEAVVKYAMDHGEAGLYTLLIEE